MSLLKAYSKVDCLKKEVYIFFTKKLFGLKYAKINVVQFSSLNLLKME